MLSKMTVLKAANEMKKITQKKQYILISLEYVYIATSGTKNASQCSVGQKS